jgi:hemolysin III
MKRADHAAIYLLIVATMTPVSLLVPPRTIGIPLLITVWIAAAIGAFLKITGRRDTLASSLYLIIGWTSALMLPWLWQTSKIYAVVVLAAGVIYSIGAGLFLKSLPRLSERVFGYHEFWHVMTIVASGLNYLAVRGIIKAIP